LQIVRAGVGVTVVICGDAVVIQVDSKSGIGMDRIA
jgi:hypothetical protein